MPGIQIIGAGNSRVAEVNPEGRLRTVAVTSQPEYHINWANELAFVIQVNVTPSPSANFYYHKNESNYSMIVEDLEVYSENNEVVTLYKNPIGTPTGGTSTIPSNSNFGSSKTADGVFQYGSDLGGLTGGTQHSRTHIIGGEENKYTFKNWVVMPKNSTFMLYAKNGNSELDLTIPFFYIPGEL